VFFSHFGRASSRAASLAGAELGRARVRLVVDDLSMRPRALSLVVLVATLAVLSSGLGSTVSPAHAASVSSVSIGEVSISEDAGLGGAAAVDVGRALRGALNDELAQIRSSDRPRRPLIVSATLQRVSSEKLALGSKASAVISLALVRADDRVLFAELRGRASVEESSASPAAARSSALKRAVHGAMVRLPEAMRRSE